MYKFIINPKTNKKIKINSSQAIQIIRNYLIQLGGSSINNKLCTICLDDEFPNDSHIDICKHSFHKHCILNWKENHLIHRLVQTRHDILFPSEGGVAWVF